MISHNNQEAHFAVVNTSIKTKHCECHFALQQAPTVNTFLISSCQGLLHHTDARTHSQYSVRTRQGDRTRWWEGRHANRLTDVTDVCVPACLDAYLATHSSSLAPYHYHPTSWRSVCPLSILPLLAQTHWGFFFKSGLSSLHFTPIL